MKQILLLLTIFAGTHFLAISQSREAPSLELLPPTSRTSLGLKMGAALPIGEFGENDLNDENSGFATVGFLIGTEIMYNISESFYFMGELTYISNPIDEDQLLVPVRNNVPSSVNVSINSSNWKSTLLNVAVGTKTSIDAKTEFCTKFGLGLHSMSSTGYSITLSDGRTTQVITQTSSRASNLNLNVGGFLKSEIDEKMSLIAGLNYIYVIQEFDDIKVTSVVNGSNNIPPETFDFSQRVESIVISLGVQFKI